jgi:hypothetical protein
MTRFATREEYQAWRASQGSTPEAGSAVAATALDTSAAVGTEKPKQGLKEAFSGMPGWAWLFVVSSLAIPVVCLGGAIPGALGFGAAAGCASVSKRTDWETPARVVVCAAITGGAWALLLAFAVAVASLQK